MLNLMISIKLNDFIKLIGINNDSDYEFNLMIGFDFDNCVLYKWLSIKVGLLKF